MSRRVWLTRIAVVLGVVFGAPSLLVASAPPGAEPAADGAIAAATAEPALGAPQVVVIGVPGVRWDDITPEGTPTLWGMVGDAALANLSIRTVTSRTCPVDGWLSLSAGQRATWPRADHSVCELPEDPDIDGSSASYPGFGKIAAYNADETQYGASIGLLGEAVQDAGGRTLAVGSGAVLGAADADGRVDYYATRPTSVPEDEWARASLAAVEIDDLVRAYLPPEPVDEEDGEEPSEPAEVEEQDRDTLMTEVDEAVAETMAEVPPNATVIVAGISMDRGASELTSLLVSGPGADGGYTHAFLTSESTRREGLVTLTDMTTAVLRELELGPVPGTVGRQWTQVAAPAEAEAVADLRAVNTASSVVGTMMAPFFTGLVTVQLVIYAAAAVVLRREWGEQRRPKVLAVTKVVALAGAAAPVAAYLANLVPWWRSDLAALAMIATVLVADGIVVAIALAGPWRRSIIGPVTIVAGITAGVLFTDIATGARLQLNSLTGYSPVVAGRFYGLGNIAFATFATGVLILAAGLAHFLIRSGHRRWAVALTLAVGLAAIGLTGWPGLGTDFGGVIALVPGIAVTALMVAGRRVTVLRFVLIGGAGLVLVFGLAFLDYLRPPDERSHFGAFIGQVLNGEAVSVVLRKLEATLGTLGNWPLTLLAACALLFLFGVLNRPLNWKAGALQLAYERVPALRAGLTGALVTAMVGFAVNDSGIAIPALALTIATPLALYASVRAMELGKPAATDPGPSGGGPNGGTLGPMQRMIALRRLREVGQRPGTS
ncbi:hypothetical protein [Allonocardiopsis opalescens]|uniref:hypothetical protein n=1 Tax=Allonocardiopsis opalescens TaxID=1144618 RepID=UPI001B802FD8|nr:hypothetical protein [Allonocardiopsis opalescens]